MYYNISDKVKVNINIEKNIYHFDLDDLFFMAERDNKKRSFLFVSKVLGKHIPVMPITSRIIGRLLGYTYVEDIYNVSCCDIKKALHLLKNYNEQESLEFLENNRYRLEKETLFIGFAETATALGHAVYNTFDNAHYIHTTRDIIDIDECICFKEEHSHATDHILYTKYSDIVKSDCDIVFVDDELTTGKTILNIIRAINEKYKRKNYNIITILDWRNEDSIEKFKELEKELDININVTTLIKGNIEVAVDNSIVYEGKEKKSYENSVEVGYIDISDYFLKKVNDLYIRDTGRFGICSEYRDYFYERMGKASEYLKKYKKGKTLCMGTGEYMYIPMCIASYMGKDVYYQSTTKSPIIPRKKENYGARNKYTFLDPYTDTQNFFYNIDKGEYDSLFIFFEREVSKDKLESLLKAVSELGISNVYIVFSSTKESIINKPKHIGSYTESDVTFLLKDIRGFIKEQNNEEREMAIQSGVHYSEMLPIEYKPSKEYMDLFFDSLNKYSEKIADAVAIVSQKIIEYKGKDIVLVSLARAGTPVGILIKRYIKYKYGIDILHYSISIIRGRGFDENALKYIIQNSDKHIVFIDGWTGKGAITKELNYACLDFYDKYCVELDYDLAVIADPGYCSPIYGTREDFLIPNSCLNSTVTGLISRTVLRKDIIGEKDFHGVVYYNYLVDEDKSKLFIDSIVSKFKKDYFIEKEKIDISWEGLLDVENIKRDFDIDNINFIKPGVGETTRVLLRRIPYKILIKEECEDIEHILVLAKEKNVELEIYPLKVYKCCGIIKGVK